jgi:hypothetical protein
MDVYLRDILLPRKRSYLLDMSKICCSAQFPVVDGAMREEAINGERTGFYTRPYRLAMVKKCPELGQRTVSISNAFEGLEIPRAQLTGLVII